mgnify:CR=1 FL=1
MFRPGELKTALAASWALFRGDTSAVSAFDVSMSGFWRSFLAIVALLPLYFINVHSEKKLLLSDGQIPAESFSEDFFWLTQFLSLGIDWILFPLILGFLARPLGLSGGYVRFIVLRNWTSILCSLPFVLAALLHLAGFLNQGGVLMISLLTVGAVLHFRYRLARIAFGAPASVCIGLVALDFLLSLLIGVLVIRA